MISGNSDLKNSNNNTPTPPLWAVKLLTFFCREDFLDEIIGDLYEAFHWRLSKKSLWVVQLLFIWETIKSLRPGNLKSVQTISLTTMIYRNYIKIAFRNLLKRKSLSFINIIGLSLGASAFILIAMYAFFILGYDQQHSNQDRTFLAYKERITPNGVQATYDTWIPLKDKLKEDYSQVVNSTRYYNTTAKVVQGERYTEEVISYSDNEFFEIFDYPILHGNPNRIFTNANSMVISKELSQKYFKEDNSIGKPLEVYIPQEDTTLRFQISAVMDDYGQNMSIRPNMMVQATSIPLFEEYANSWGGSFIETFVTLQNKDQAAELEAMFPDLVESIWSEKVRNNTNFKLLPFNDYYDTFLGRKQDAITLLIIGLGILLIATINFMNLSTAQASQRTKEIGIRKVLGALRGQLRVQFFTEAMVSSILATILGAVIVILVLPYFNNYFDLELAISNYPTSSIIIGIIGLASILSILSGSYPSLYLSSLKVIDSLRNKMGFSGSVTFRNSLVVLQFAISLFLIATTILIKKQIDFMSDKNMGFDGDGIMVIDASRNDFIDQENGMERLNSLKNELGTLSYVESVSTSRSIPTDWSGSYTFVKPDGWTGDPMRMRYTHVDSDFIGTFDMKLKQGRNFFDDSQGDQRTSALLNEAALEAFGFELNEDKVLMFGDFAVNVVGILQDFNFESLQEEIEPLIIFHRRPNNRVHRFISCKMNMTDLPDKIAEIELLWEDLNSTSEFTFRFMDQEIQDLYESERRYLGMVTLFSALSIIVACMGLYGLTLFIIEKRRKEMSIRKVLGANISEILRLIVRDFTRWVFIAFILSVPFVLYFTSDWLTSFHYRIEIGWTTFLYTFMLVVALILLTVGYHSITAARSNPTRYLKDE